MAKAFIRYPKDDMRVMLALEEVQVKPEKIFTGKPNLAIADITDHDRMRLRDRGCMVYPDIKFEVTPDLVEGKQMSELGENARYWESQEATAPMGPSQSLDDVLAHIGAPQAWLSSTGKNVTIAVIDTGTCPTLKEFPMSKRSHLDIPSHYHKSHWQDTAGQGSMCAAIATAQKVAGARFNGVAPDATLLSARTTLQGSDIPIIYDQLTTWKRNGTISGPLVTSNSYGLYTCTPPGMLPPDHPFLEVVLDAINAGIVVVYAAGNNHWDVLCNNPPQQCHPNTIWAVNSHDQVISVGTVNQNNSNQDPSTPHPNSSRGPGQWASAYPKPDCVAPTYGTVVWGCGYKTMPWWGTSGACPQVAGLAALILSVRPTLSPAQVADIIRKTCKKLGAAHECVGHGLIDCPAAVSAAISV